MFLMHGYMGENHRGKITWEPCNTHSHHDIFRKYNPMVYVSARHVCNVKENTALPSTLFISFTRPCVMTHGNDGYDVNI